MGLYYSNYAVDDGKLWLLGTDFSILCCLNYEDKKIYYVADLSINNEGRNGCYSSLVKHGSSIYAIPSNGTDIVEYNTETNIVNHYCIVELENLDEPKGKFGSAIIVDDCLYCIGNLYKGIIKFNTINKEYSVINIDTDIPLWKNNCVIGGYIYIPHAPYTNSNEIIIYNIENDSYQKKDVNIYGGVAGLNNFNEKLYAIASNYYGIYEIGVDAKSDFAVKNCLFEESEREGINIGWLFKHNNFFYSLPWKGSEILKIDPNSKTKSIYKFNEDDSIKYIYANYLDDLHIAGFYKYGESFDVIDLQSLEVKRYKNQMPIGVGDVLKKIFNEKNVFKESKRLMNLEIFISTL